jgi:NH3-dependent NAD+ synthetase
MGFTYDTLEAYLQKGPSAVDTAIAERIERLRKVSEHKRSLPPVGPK